jgi:hypothetical protein
MSELILLSSLVSLITLGILFLQRINPEKIKIPSYFLGGKSEQRLQQIKSKPPFWWEVLAVLLFTAGAGLAFYSQPPALPEGQNKAGGLVWFDPTFSHIRNLRSSRAARESVFEALRDLRYSEYTFIETKYSANADGIPEATFDFRKVPASGLEAYIMEAISNPSALSQPLEAQRLIQNLSKTNPAAANGSALTIVSDAQAETLRPLSVLSSWFPSVNVIRTPAGSLETSAVSRTTQLVPEELAVMWETGGKDSPSEALPSTPKLIKLEDGLGSRIPRQARPSLMLEEYELQEPENSQAQTYALISSGNFTHGDASNNNRAAAPLLTTCTLSVAGPSELDGLSDLRAFAQYFRFPVRPMACRGTSSASSSRSADAADPWKYRRSSIWIVPVADSVAGDLFQQGLFWIPEGFSPEHDAMVYIADTRLTGSEGLLESVSVQLEANQTSVRLQLLPLPPANLTFPWELGRSGTPVPTRPIAQNLANLKTPLLKAADGTPLAYTLSANPPVVYLRTGGAAPNGELGRWGKWAGLWSQISAQLRSHSPSLTKLQIKSPQDWTRWFEEQQKQRTPKLRYYIDGRNLGAQIINNIGSLAPVPALYLRERDDHMILIEPPLSERVSDVLSATELEQLFPNHTTAARKNITDNSKASPLQWLGGIIAFLSALTLWFLQFKKNSQLKTAGAAVLLTVSLCFGLSSAAQAQGLRVPYDARVARSSDTRGEINTFPFRIGWCDSVVPEPVKSRYRMLQTLLANRGTINLPRELTAGGCRLGASEIWWTSSLEALQSAPVTQHIRSGGLVVAEGISLRQTPEWMLLSSDPSIGLTWESPKKRGLLYRSFYLLSSFDSCTPERTLLLTLRKKVNAQAPMGIVTPVRFLTITSEGTDCFVGDDDYRSRSFVNLMYSLLTTDYKEDQMQLPEILNRVRNLGLEP